MWESEVSDKTGTEGVGSRKSSLGAPGTQFRLASLGDELFFLSITVASPSIPEWPKLFVPWLVASPATDWVTDSEGQEPRNFMQACQSEPHSHAACATEAPSQESGASSDACPTLIKLTSHNSLSSFTLLLRSLGDVASGAPKSKFQPLVCLLAIVYLPVAQSVHFEK